MLLAAAITGVLLALAFAGSGGAKLAGVTTMRESAQHLGFSFSTYRVIGALEALGALGILIGLYPGQPIAMRLGVAAAIGLAVLMLGAVGSHLRVRDSITGWAPALVLALLAVIYAALLTAPRVA